MIECSNVVEKIEPAFLIPDTPGWPEGPVLSIVKLFANFRSDLAYVCDITKTLRPLI